MGAALAYDLAVLLAADNVAAERNEGASLYNFAAHQMNVSDLMRSGGGRAPALVERVLLPAAEGSTHLPGHHRSGGTSRPRIRLSG